MSEPEPCGAAWYSPDESHGPFGGMGHACDLEPDHAGSHECACGAELPGPGWAYGLRIAPPACPVTWQGGRTATGARVTHECDRPAEHDGSHLCACGAAVTRETEGAS